MHLPGVFGLQGPPVVGFSFRAQELERIGHSWVVGQIGLLKIVQGPQNVVSPAARPGKPGHFWVDDSAGFVGFEKTVHQDKPLRSGRGSEQFREAIGIAVLLIFQYAFQHRNSGMQRTVHTALAVRLAIETAVYDPLRKQKIHD